MGRLLPPVVTRTAAIADAASTDPLSLTTTGASTLTRTLPSAGSVTVTATFAGAGDGPPSVAASDVPPGADTVRRLGAGQRPSRRKKSGQRA